LGDNGEITYTGADFGGTAAGDDTDAADIDEIVSTSTTVGGGSDTITSLSGDDIIIGGRYGDTIDGGEGDNLVIGDSGRITAAGEDAPQFAGQPITLGRVETIEDTDGGIDTITTLTGYDIIFGGHGGDTITASLIPEPENQAATAPDSGNIIFGDTGYIDYDIDGNPDDIDEIASTTTTAEWGVDANLDAVIVDVGGIDTIDTGDGDDIIIGGRFGDNIEARNGDNIVFGDSGRITASTVDSETQAQFAGQPITLGRVETIEDTDGGIDTITTLSGYDIVLGGHGGDGINVGEGNNIVLGDTGYIDWDDDQLLDQSNATDAADIDEIKSTSTIPTDGVNSALLPVIVDVGGADTITSGAGDDIVIGGRFDDGIDAGDGDNLVFGDSGHILAATIDSISGQEHFDNQPITFGRVETITDTDGGADTITTGDGYDIVLGGHANDTIKVEFEYGGTVDADGSNIVLGDTGYIDWDDDELIPAETNLDGDPSAYTVTTTDNPTNPDDIDEILSTTTTPPHETQRLLISEATAGDIELSLNGSSVAVGYNVTAGQLQEAVQSLVDDDITVSVTMTAPNNFEIAFAGPYSDPTVTSPNVPQLIITNFTDGVVTLGTIVDGDVGGVDTIDSGNGDDIIIGGRFGDTINGYNGDNVVIGDSGRILGAKIDSLPGVARVNNLAGQPMTFGLITTLEPADGGNDTIQTGDDNDIILGGFANDDIHAGGDDDYILGDNGYLQYDRASDNITLNSLRRPDVIAHLGELAPLTDGTIVDLDNPDNPDPRTLDLVTTTDPTFGGDDIIRGNADNDVIFGGTGSDIIWADNEAVDDHVYTGQDDGNDIVFGDHGRMYPSIDDPYIDGEFFTGGAINEVVNPEFDAFFINNNFFSIDTQDVDGANTDADPQLDPNPDENRGKPNNFNDFEDIIFGSGGDDTIIGGQDDDILFGGEDNDILIGGHNVIGGHDELDPMDSALKDAILSGVLADSNPSDINDVNDIMDGGGDEDVMAGDNAIIIRQNADTSSFLPGSQSLRYQELDGGEIYSMVSETVGGIYDVNVGFEANITGTPMYAPGSNVGYTVILLDHSGAVAADAAQNDGIPRVFGNDVMAGGASNDEMFGQLGDDIMQGDGSIDFEAVGVADTIFDPSPGENPSFTIPDQILSDYFADEYSYDQLYFSVNEDNDPNDTYGYIDGDDYMEGNGGNDRMYGNLGQDDMIGGSSTLFGLDDVTAQFYGMAADDFARPDGADMIYGGAGDPTRLNRNDYVGPSDTAPGDDIILEVNRHARDADVIAGDNANIYRLVNVVDLTDNGIDDPTSEYLQYAYDLGFDPNNPETIYETRGELRIIPRAVELLDYGYTFTNPEDPASLAFSGTGAGDLIYGESGDDIIHGMTGDDVLFGNSEDDDIYGEAGNDWISGGTGEDGILGDDGLIKTSRNDLIAESLYGISALSEDQGELKNNEEVDPNSLNAEISTPGNIQQAIINVEGELKKSVDLLAFDASLATGVNDIIYGGLNNDFIHAGGGDDAVSGGEALPAYYSGEGFGFETINSLLQLQQQAPTNPGDANADEPFWFDFAPYNPGDILRYEGNTDPNDPHGKTKQEFALYDEFNPRRKVMLDETGNAVATEAEAVYDFLLNFNEDEGPDGYAFLGDDEALPTDGDDRIFGDLGNDWIVGGTGRDHMYGGRGDDLLNMDDNHDSGSGGKVGPHDPQGDALDNTLSDEYQAYSDIAYGGAGRDIMILNTGADRAIDWVGEYNSYIVPFSPFGAFQISRALAPQVPEFLQNLSVSDGVDTTVPDGARYVEQKNLDVRVDEPDPLRNGEPYGELGMVRQPDYDWQDQTGAPNDPQPGNLQGKREIMRRELFTDEEAVQAAFAPDKGTWLITNGSYDVAPAVLGEEAISIYHLDMMQPSYMEILATVSADKAIGGLSSNAYIIFDYQSATDFKFAGIDAGLDKIQIGHRTAGGWVIDTQINMQLKWDTNYDLTLVMYGTVATIWVNESISASFDFGSALNTGYIGLGSDNSKAVFDDFQVQKLPPTITFEFTAAEPDKPGKPEEYFIGNWQISGAQYTGTPDAGTDKAIAIQWIELAPYSKLEMEAAIQTATEGGIVFDYYGLDDFKFAALKADTNQVVIGHRTAKGWFIDAEAGYSIDQSQSYTLGVNIFGSNASVTVNGEAVLGYVFNSLLNDGEFGLLSKDGASTFDNFVFRGDDPAYSMSLPPVAAIADASVLEGDSGTNTAYINIELSKPADVEVSVDYTTVDGTAIAGEDYIQQTGTATFAPGETGVQIAIPILSDTEFEGDETFTVQLANPNGLTVEDDSSVVTIIGDDAPPVVSVADSTVIEGNDGSSSVTVEFTLSKVAAETVTVNYATADGTAVAGDDYVSQTGTVTFAPGQTSALVSFGIVGDTVQEPDETFTVNLTNAVNGQIGDGTGVVTIQNDDQIPVVMVTASDSSAAEAGSDVGVFVVSRSQDLTDGDLTVSLDLSGLATLDDDYTVTSSDGIWDGANNTLTLLDGSATASLTITPNDDDVAEGTEDVTLTVAPAAGYTVGTEASAAVNIADNDTPLPSISIENITVVEGDRPNNKVTLTVTLSEVSADPISVNLSTSNSTAIWGEDYRTLETTVYFNPGETSQKVTVRIIGDTVSEPTERFLVELSNATNAVIAGEGVAEVTIIDDDGAGLEAAGKTTATGDTDSLTDSQLTPIVAEAINRWENILGADSTLLANLYKTKYLVVDFDGLTLGQAAQNTIYIDSDAAGYGWFVDETPEDDVEFGAADSAAAGRMDLLTAVMHEMGHVMGYDHTEQGLMADTLESGTRTTDVSENTDTAMIFDENSGELVSLESYHGLKSADNSQVQRIDFSHVNNSTDEDEDWKIII